MSASKTLTTKEIKDKAATLKKNLEKNIKTSPEVSSALKTLSTINFDTDIEDMNNDLKSHIIQTFDVTEWSKFVDVLLHYINVQEHKAIRGRILHNNMDTSQYQDEMKLSGIIELIKFIKQAYKIK